MVPKSERSVLRFAAAVLAGAFVALAAWVMSKGPVPGDQRALTELHETIGGSIDQAMVIVSNLTDLLPLAVVAVGVLAVLLHSSRRRDAAFFVVGVAVVWAVNPVLKEVVGRSRPDIWPTPESVSVHSFPSGHAAHTAALVGALVAVLRTKGRRVMATVVGAALLAVVGFSQLVLGVHYPSDILAGWLWAGAWIIFLWSARSSQSPSGSHAN